MTQEFSDYTYATSYYDIMSIDDIYAFMRGPVLASTIFTAEQDQYVTSFQNGFLRSTQNQNWIVAGVVSALLSESGCW